MIILVTSIHSQSKCFFFGPISSSVVALHTDFARPCPAKLCRAASSLSCIVWPAIADDSSSMSGERFSFLPLSLVSFRTARRTIYLGGFNERNREKIYLIKGPETNLKTILHVDDFFPPPLCAVKGERLEILANVVSGGLHCRLSLLASCLSPTFLIIIIMTAMKKHTRTRTRTTYHGSIRPSSDLYLPVDRSRLVIWGRDRI